ncbi:MAG: APC family permease [Conexivisphaerales archaeon]
MESASNDQTQTKLKRSLKLRDLYLAAISAIFATAWILSPYFSAAIAGPASIISWVIGGVFITIIAITWAEIGSMLPLSGGVARYLTYTHGKVAGAMMGWANLLTTIVYPALETVALTSFIQALISIYDPRSTIKLISSIGTPTYTGVVVALLVVSLLFVINYTGVRNVKIMNIVANIIKLIAMPAAIIFILAFGLYHGFGSNFVVAGFAPYGYAPVFTIIPATGIVFAYLGFRQPIDMAAEAVNARKDVGRAILLAMATAFAIYTLMEVAFIGGLKWDSASFGTSGVTAGNWIGLTSSLRMATMPILYETVGLGIFVITVLVAAAGLVGPPADAGQYMASTARILYGISRDGFLGKSFSRVHAKYRIPYLGVLITFIVTTVLLLLGVAGYLVTSIGGAWLALVSIVSTTSVFAYMVGPLALIILRKTNPNAERPFKVKYASVVAPLAFIISGLMFYWGAGVLFSSGDPYGGYILIILLLAGVLLFYTRDKASEKTQADLKNSMWIIIFLILNIILLALGSYQLNIIKMPYDWILDIIINIFVYIYAIRSSLSYGTITNTVENLLKIQEGEA